MYFKTIDDTERAESLRRFNGFDSHDEHDYYPEKSITSMLPVRNRRPKKWERGRYV